MSLAVEFPLHNSSLQTAQPQYSIVVPAYNERARIGETLERILEHLREQKWSAEIVVVNDGSQRRHRQLRQPIRGAGIPRCG